MQKFLLSIIGVLLVLVTGVGVFLYSCEDDWCFVMEWQKVRAADSFTRCAQLGFPVMESFPRQCRAGTKHYVEGGGDHLVTLPPRDTSVLSSDERIRVDRPSPALLVQSPLAIAGAARGNWYFEASFPARLLDGNGEVIALTPLQAMGEWMTTEFVPFEGELAFPTPKTNTGTLVLAKDNPSGLPEHEASVAIPLRFALYMGEDGVLMRTVDLYYYNAENDLDLSGNAACTERGLAPVERTIISSKTPVADTLKLFLLGLIREDERRRGVVTEYPLPGLMFKSVTLEGGVLTVTLDDPLHRTQGGACRTTLLRAQLERTLRQFSGVSDVRFIPADLFQP